MGQRTQIGVNVRYIEENGTEHIERAIFHYQWGGYSNIMFESLISLFLEVRNYIYDLKDEKFGNSNQRMFDFEIKKQNFLKIIVDKLISKECKKISEDISKDKKNNMNELSEKEFWTCTLQQDCDDGRIIVDILLDKEKSYCKWNFLKNKTFGLLLNFKEIIENELTYNPYEVPKYWVYDNVYEEEFKKIIEIIKFLTTYTKQGYGNTLFETIEYDRGHFEKKFSQY